MKFYKWHGLGNDFVIINYNENPNCELAAIAHRVCDRHFGIGADGLVSVRHLGGNAFEMRIYNSDGSETEMCGNATRCVGLFIKNRKLVSGREYELHTRAGIIRPTVLENDSVRVDMGEPHLLRGEIPVTGRASDNALNLELTVGSRKFIGNAVSMGNPHVVIFVPEVAKIKLAEWGSQIECDKLFPRKTNVEFVQVLSHNLIRIRVWERGCGVTLACGTGSCASAVAGFLTGRTGRNVSVLLDGGELQIEYSENDNHVYMTGPAVEVFQGEININ
ncbi:MAG: diaminopimelate epimerase [Victivallaceae bacterium]|nr:diaminopimelate epimerase [Victivallaceae bacterium]NLK84280.1 diaminopimelate epimerase [Lentisphaerota bacterium]MDD3115954.1 diaminopimelate epimerase [Victivallaceae bacterium]MDD3702790.1 diaminopimelate epimerase [Victivallaceae bacterium]MDD4317399.1 diaminopimelate epimerase [Victivallaceae bacterium]